MAEMKAAAQTAVRTLVNGHPWLVVRTDLPGVRPAETLRWFTAPEKLARWWAPEATTAPEPGGEFALRWPAQGWTLRGTYAIANDHLLVFSWAWDHEPNPPARAVIVEAAETDGSGTRLTVSHGPFDVSEDEDRRGTLEGWQFFLPRLAAAISAST